jgi:hypothetical protein
VLAGAVRTLLLGGARLAQSAAGTHPAPPPVPPPLGSTDVALPSPEGAAAVFQRHVQADGAVGVSGAATGGGVIAVCDGQAGAGVPPKTTTGP